MDLSEEKIPMIIDIHCDIHIVLIGPRVCPFQQEAVKLYNQTVAQKRLLALAEGYLALDDEVSSTDDKASVVTVQFL